MVNGWTILVKPTNECNMNCKYCYDKPLRIKYKGCRMSNKMIEHIAMLASNYSTQVNWIWHGGEPTLMGPEWYNQIQQIFYKYYKTKWNFSMQTNGTLLNDYSWIDTLKNNRIDLGVSFDVFTQATRTGIKKDIYNIEGNLIKYKNAGCNIGTISVLTNMNYKRMIDMYEFFKTRIQINTVSFNMVFATKDYKDNNFYNSYIKEYKKFIYYWLQDTSDIAIEERLTVNMIKNLFGQGDLLCQYTDCRYGWLGIHSNGDIYPCAKYIGEDYYFGNISDYNNVSDIYNSKGFQYYYVGIQERIEKNCIKCEYYEYCNGGCPVKHILSSNNLKGLDNNECKLFINELEAIYSLLREIDIYKNNYNHNLIKLILNGPFFTVKEIRKFLEKKGENIESNYDNFINSKEFKVFQIFNINKKPKIDKDNVLAQYIIYKPQTKSGKFNNLKEFENDRTQILQKIYEDNKEKIELLLRGE